VARGPGGERTIAAADFFTGLFETALGPDEMLTEVRVPKLEAGQGWSYEKFNRRAIDWAIVGVAAFVDREDGGVGSARIALTNMGATPLRATAAEEALAGAGGDGIAAAADRAAEGTSPPSDTNASAEFRQHLARVLTRRAVDGALAG
jgi:aerobic carbon-monoxide dehydrogenase medium subunit